MGLAMNIQVVVLVGGLSKKLYPLTSKDVPKVLLPLGNKPLLAYVLELLEASNLKDIIMVVAGEDAAFCIGNWVAATVHDRLRVEVAAVPEDSDTADALRTVMHRLTAEDFLVVSGDLVSNVPIGAVAAAHRRQGALVTALLCNRVSLCSCEPGSEKIKQPPICDIIGLDSTQQHLLYVAPGPESEKNVLVRRSLLRAVGNMVIRTDFVDAHLYAFNRFLVQGVLESRPNIKSIKQDLVPYLVRSQLRLGVPSTAVETPVEDKVDIHHQSSLPYTKGLAQLLRAPQSRARVTASSRARVTAPPLKCCAYIASKGKFCMRVNSLQAYLDINREIAGEAIHLTGNSHNNVIDEKQLGRKSTVGPQCMLGEGSTLGEKCSVKKSVAGRHCRIGSNVKIMNSVVMDYVTVEDGCTIQNSIICSNVNLQERCSLKDCQVGPGYVVGARLELKGDALAKKEKQ